MSSSRSNFKSRVCQHLLSRIRWRYVSKNARPRLSSWIYLVSWLKQLILELCVSFSNAATFHQITTCLPLGKEQDVNLLELSLRSVLFIREDWKTRHIRRNFHLNRKSGLIHLNQLINLPGWLFKGHALRS